MNLKKIKEQIDRVKVHEWGHLDLKNCGLKEIPIEVFESRHLVTIDLSNDTYCPKELRNTIRNIPVEVVNLKHLTKLNFANNELHDIPEALAELKELRSLNLANNNLTDLPSKIANMPSLKELNLENNPFDMLPPEIAARGIDSIRNFFKELEEKDFLYEVKLIVVGEGRVGKTCITHALVNADFSLEETESTEGINISRWVIPQNEIASVDSKIQRDFQINIWDFGGQEIYHSTHQFFLTKRSIYLLVTESRKEDSHDDFFYWLNIIKLLGDKSPVVMVLNKCDQPTKELPIKEYKETFNNIIDFQKISLKTGYEESLKIFKEKLKHIATSLPHIGTPLPKVWVDIRREIEDLKLAGANYITEAEYFEICKKHYRNAESALFLSTFFHDLGVLLHFHDDIELKDTVILNHEWITSGVYRILDDRKVIEQKGRFTNEDIVRIWSNDEHKTKIRELLSLMKNKKFDLCFELSNGDYLVPRLLPVDEIEHEWLTSSENLRFEIRYKFMPKGIVARLIVKLSTDISNNLYWRYGVVLQYDNTKAIVKEKYFENKITIEVSGENKREYLFVIRKAISEIHKDFNKLRYAEMVPCSCSVCRTIEEPFFYDFDLLRRYELKSLQNIRCDKSLEEVPVSGLTNSIGIASSSNERLFICENLNADILNKMGFENHVFYGEKDSSSVFIQVKTKPEKYFGLRDRDFLLDSEIKKIRDKYPNYCILDYYCIENYLFHPDNIDELKLAGFDKSKYIKEISKQKEEKKMRIISNFKSARKGYQEFKIERERLMTPQDEERIIEYLNSDDIEIFFKAFSMKDHFNKDIINKYNLTQLELSKTTWFQSKIIRILNMATNITK